MKKEELLTLPVSVTSWVVLLDYLERFWDIDVLFKMVTDYFRDIPLFEVDRIICDVEKQVDDVTFQVILDFLFRQIMDENK